MNLYIVLQQLQMVIQMLNNVEVKGKTNLTNQAAGIDVLERLQAQITEELEKLRTQEPGQTSTDEE